VPFGRCAEVGSIRLAVVSFETGVFFVEIVVHTKFSVLNAAPENTTDADTVYITRLIVQRSISSHVNQVSHGLMAATGVRWLPVQVCSFLGSS